MLVDFLIPKKNGVGLLIASNNTATAFWYFTPLVPSGFTLINSGNCNSNSCATNPILFFVPLSILSYKPPLDLVTLSNTFSIGLEGSPDLAYSEIVAKYINSNHHHVEVEVEDCLSAVEDVVYATETFELRTLIASSTMYLLSRYIRDNT